MIQRLRVMKLEMQKKQTILKNITCKTQNFYILLEFLLITIALLIAVSISCYFKKYQAKEKHLLPFHNTSNETKQVLH